MVVSNKGGIGCLHLSDIRLRGERWVQQLFLSNIGLEYLCSLSSARCPRFRFYRFSTGHTISSLAWSSGIFSQYSVCCYSRAGSHFIHHRNWKVRKDEVSLFLRIFCLRVVTRYFGCHDKWGARRCFLFSAQWAKIFSPLATDWGIAIEPKTVPHSKRHWSHQKWIHLGNCALTVFCNINGMYQKDNKTLQSLTVQKSYATNHRETTLWR